MTASAAVRRRQMGDLVRLREVRMRTAQRALAEARAATAIAERARAAADAAADAAVAAHAAAREQLADDPGEAERLLALVDQRRFQRSMAIEALTDARDAEHQCQREEAERRRGMIVAQARFDILDARFADLRADLRRVEEERAAIEAEDIRRFR